MTIRSGTVDATLAALAAKTPTPGGGAVAGLTAALGAALGAMVIAYSTGKKAFADHADLHAEAEAALAALTGEALDLADADAVAYGRMNALWGLDADDPKRRAEMPDAVRDAIAVPERVLAASERLLALLERLAGRTSRMLASDLAIAAVLAAAAGRAAAWNVRINLPMLEDATDRVARERDIDERLARLDAGRETVETACRPPADG